MGPFKMLSMPPLQRGDHTKIFYDLAPNYSVNSINLSKFNSTGGFKIGIGILIIMFITLLKQIGQVNKAPNYNIYGSKLDSKIIILRTHFLKLNYMYRSLLNNSSVTSLDRFILSNCKSKFSYLYNNRPPIWCTITKSLSKRDTSIHKSIYIDLETAGAGSRSFIMTIRSIIITNYASSWSTNSLNHIIIIRSLLSRDYIRESYIGLSCMSIYNQSSAPAPALIKSHTITLLTTTPALIKSHTITLCTTTPALTQAPVRGAGAVQSKSECSLKQGSLRGPFVNLNITKSLQSRQNILENCIGLSCTSIYNTSSASAPAIINSHTITLSTTTPALINSHTITLSTTAPALAQAPVRGAGADQSKSECSIKQGSLRGPFVKTNMPTHNHWSLSNKMRNTIMRAVNGNTIKLLQLNKSSSNILKKHTLIKDLLDREDCMIGSLNESNCDLSKTDQINPFKGFKAEHKTLKYRHIETTVARTTMLIKSGLDYTRMFDLEPDLNSLIWVKINLKNRNPILVCSGYRQWSLPKELGFKGSKKLKYQRARFETYLDSIRRAIKSGLKVVILHDCNIDISHNNNHNIQFNIKQLYEMYYDFLNVHDLIILNKKHTRYSSHQSPSTLDHIVTNMPEFMSDVTTEHNLISDHCTLTCSYLGESREYRPRFRVIRDWKSLTPDRLKYAVQKNIKLQNLTYELDTNVVAETLHCELNNIIDDIAPQRRVYNTKDYEPYLTTEIRDNMSRVNMLLTSAIKSGKREDWRLHNHERNKLYKEIDIAKKDYLKSRLCHNIHGWKLIKSYNGLEKAKTPSKIKFNAAYVSSPAKIANIANDFYISKVINLAKPMISERRDPVKLLSLLIKRRQDNIFKLRFISRKETFDMIKNLPNSAATGIDSICNKILKRLGWSIVPQICHMINSVIRTSVFPTIFKTTRIIPVSKPGKPPDSIDSYRPINNLPTLEKLLEQWIKICLVDWLEEFNVISGDHHGGRQGYSTLTAITKIKQQINSNLQNNYFNILITTDLSAAFDTVDHVTLLRKMDHHGIRGKELGLFKSYLEDRRQLVEVETFRSEVKTCPDLSCIQGSKMANTFYTIYNLELTVIQQLMNCPTILNHLLTPSPTNLLNYTLQAKANAVTVNTSGAKSNTVTVIKNIQIKNNQISGAASSDSQARIKVSSKDDTCSDCQASKTLFSGKDGAGLGGSQSVTTNGKKSSKVNVRNKSIYDEEPSQMVGLDTTNYKVNINIVKGHSPGTYCKLCTGLDKVTNRDNNHYIDANHYVTQYVDDSTSNIGIKSRQNIEPYIKTYLDVLYNYYTINCLTLNRSKTKFTVIGNQRQIALTKDIKIKINDDFIYCDGQVRILGHLFSSDNSVVASVNEIIREVNFRIHNLNLVRNITNFETRLKFLSSYVLGKINYLLPLLLSAPKTIVHQMHLLQVKAAKCAWNQNTFKISNKTILDRCGWPSITAYMQYHSLTYVHRILYTTKPSTILSLFKIPNRLAKNIGIKEKLDSKYTKNFFLYKAIGIYNSLKTELKALPPKKFKKELRKVIGYNGIDP